MPVSAKNRQERERSKQKWDNLTRVVQKEFHNLESWVKNNAQKHIDKVTKNLIGDLSETEFRREMEVIDRIKTYPSVLYNYTMEKEVFQSRIGPVLDNNDILCIEV